VKALVNGLIATSRTYPEWTTNAKARFRLLGERKECFFKPNFTKNKGGGPRSRFGKQIRDKNAGEERLVQMVLGKK